MSGPTHSPLVIVVMGVSGCGKSTVGRVLAKRLGWVFQEEPAEPLCQHPPDRALAATGDAHHHDHQRSVNRPAHRTLPG